MQLNPQANIELARRYLELIEQGASPSDFEAILHPDILQEELPNLLVSNGGKRNREAMLEGVEQGKKILSSQSFTVRNAIASGEWVAMELLWKGTLAVEVGKLKAGDELIAHVGTFLRIHDGKIIAQRNYDCYEPFDR